MNTIEMIDPKTSSIYDIPVSEMTNYMLQGLEPVEKVGHETNNYILCQTCQDSYLPDDTHECDIYLKEDVDASEAIDRDMSQQFLMKKRLALNILRITSQKLFATLIF